MTYRDAIQDRVSVRTFADRPLDTDTIATIQTVLDEKAPSPFGQNARFQLVNNDVQKAKLGTYGFIKNASQFIAGAIVDAAWAEVDFGFQLEKIILDLTRHGLATCWLGGTFKRTAFAEAMVLQENELLPCITPVGFSANEQRFTEKLIRRAAGSDSRKPWEELFFQDDFHTPLIREDTGDFEVLLDMLRLAPSASNKQPWRIIKYHDFYHLMLNRTRGYKSQIKSADLQLVDMGIAMCHWALVAREVGIVGQWKRLDSVPVLPKAERVEYSATWVN